MRIERVCNGYIRNSIESVEISCGRLYTNIAQSPKFAAIGFSARPVLSSGIVHSPLVHSPLTTHHSPLTTHHSPHHPRVTLSLSSRSRDEVLVLRASNGLRESGHEVNGFASTADIYRFDSWTSLSGVAVRRETIAPTCRTGTRWRRNAGSRTTWRRASTPRSKATAPGGATPADATSSTTSTYASACCRAGMRSTPTAAFAWRASECCAPTTASGSRNSVSPLP